MTEPPTPPPQPDTPSPEASSTPEASSDLLSGLSVKQQQALQRLLKGLSDGHVAREVGVDRKTVYRWRTSDPAFKAALEAERKRQWTESTRDATQEVTRQEIEAVNQEIRATRAIKPLTVEGIKARLELKDRLLLQDLGEFDERRVRTLQRLEAAIEQYKYYLDALSKDDSVVQQVTLTVNEYKTDLLRTLVSILDEEVASPTTREAILTKLAERMSE